MKKLVLSAVMSTLVLGATTANATHYYKRIVKDKYLNKICISFSSPVSSTWHSILSTAVDKYNSAFKSSTKLGFCYKYASDSNVWGETANIHITVDDFGNTGWNGMGDFPSRWSKRPGRDILINTYNIEKLEYNERIALIMHEIGHNIGLCHTNESSGCTAIPNTNSIQKSLFREQTGDNSYKSPEFSSDDLKAIRYLY